MRRRVFIVAIVVGFAFAADPAVVIDSAAMFEGALEGISDITAIAHLPGDGLDVNARWLGASGEDEVVVQLASIVSGLAGLVRGLDPGDWTGPIRPGQPESLETSTDGVLRPSHGTSARSS